MSTKKVLYFASALLLATLAFGLVHARAGVQGHPHVAHTINAGFVGQAAPPPAGTQLLFSNLGPSPTDNFNDATGYYVLGPNNTVALSEQWIALPFTVRAASHVTQVQTAVQDDGSVSGQNKVILEIAADNGSGAPGTILGMANATVNSMFGTCCTTTNGSYAAPGIALSAGTQYWLVAMSSDAHAAGLTAVWSASNLYNIGGNVAQGGWFGFSANVPAAAIRGTVP